MVVRHIGRRDEDAGRAGSADLIAGGAARPADDDIRRRHDSGHVVNILPDVQRRTVFPVHAVVHDTLRHPLLAEAAGGVDVVEGEVVGLLQRHHVRDGLVHDLRALTAEGGDDHEAA